MVCWLGCFLPRIPCCLLSSPARSLFLTLILGWFLAIAGCGGTSDPPAKPADDRDPEKPDEPGTSTSVPTTAPIAAPELTRADRIRLGVEASQKGDFDRVTELLRPLVVKDPGDVEVLFHMANAQAALGDLESAISLLDQIPIDHPEAGFPALGVSAGWCLEAGKFEQAEMRYRKVLQINPNVSLARRQLAYLLNRQGRRFEAADFVRQLCRDGDVMIDELYSLISISDSIHDEPGTQPSDGTRPYFPIGAMGRARNDFTLQQYQDAADEIRPRLESNEAIDSEIAFYGRALVEAQDDASLADWLGRVDDSTRQFPDYWAALGAYLIREAQFESGVVALAEALRLDPTDTRSIRRMFQGLRSLGREEEAERWIERHGTLNRILRASDQIAADPDSNLDQYQTLADDLESVGRSLESVLWRSIAAAKSPDGGDRLSELGKQLKRLLADSDGTPDQNQRWCGSDFSGLPLPEFPASIASASPRGKAIASAQGGPADNASQPQTTRARFRDVAELMGLDHAYLVGKTPRRKRFAMYQTFGGGVAVIDFDVDGEPDLYLAQGAADAETFVADQSDQLYRNTVTSQSRRFASVSGPAGIDEQDYTLGVTSGDWNQDGLPDLAVSNVGVNRLLINQGDGTFRSQPLDDSPRLTRLSTSLAMADVTGDHLPDLYVANYLDDTDISKLPELDADGNPVDAIPPLSVVPTRDQLYVNSNDGRWQPRLVGQEESDACTGLGIVVTDLVDERGRDPDGNGVVGTNELLVANDIRKNQLWSVGPSGRLVDLAVGRGCAYGSSGSATGAMGIALADFDRSGSADLHVTNFANEPVSFFVSAGGLFRDQNYKFGLLDVSTPWVGFGSQAVDYANDGWPDILVANGHVEDLRTQGQSFAQPLQLLANRGGRFEPAEMEGTSFSDGEHVGRAVATLDFNRDGKRDFVLTDLVHPTSLWLNESTNTNHWVSIRLIGTQSERDAIGARIRVETPTDAWVNWVTAGDGYLCKNEPSVHFGLGAQTQIDRITIDWPSGQTQVIDEAGIDQAITVIESQE